MDTIEKIKIFLPYNQQEVSDKNEIINALMLDRNLFTRENKKMHMTASAWVVNKSKTKTLMAYHNIYNSWSWMGGHTDGNADLLSVAIKEVKEESGVNNIRVITDEIFSLEVLTVAGHEKNGEYISSHLHLNITFLLEADENEELRNNPAENSDVSWISISDLEKFVSEDWMMSRVYKKLIKKVELSTH